MATREEINKVIDDILVEVVESARWNPKSDMLKVIPGFRKALLKRLDSLGVVKKVERELPSYTSRGEPNNLCRLGFAMARRDMLKAGYEATEPLTGEE